MRFHVSEGNYDTRPNTITILRPNCISRVMHSGIILGGGLHSPQSLDTSACFNYDAMMPQRGAYPLDKGYSGKVMLAAVFSWL